MDSIAIQRQAAARTSVSSVILYGSTIFLSAFLLFQVQPIIGKLILPWFGGSASVWTVCLLFFQLVLLGGYLYTHWVVGALSPRHQSWLHIGVLVAACLTLPILPSAEWKPLGDEDPALRILGLLGATIGLPYFALSTTGPLLQAWFARERPGAVPYRLFALSNLGSMIALIGYPLAIEPYSTTRWQSWGWSAGFVVFAACCAFLALRGARGARQAVAQAGPASAAPTLGRMALWAALAACPSILLVAVTSHLTQNIAPVPMLWLPPLALYLLSFILCFDHPRWYRRTLYVPLFLAGAAALAWLPTQGTADVSPTWQIVIYVAALFVFCMICHGELSRLRPDPSHLTGFYLMLSLGGAMGGLFVGVIAPNFFAAEFELAIGLALTVAVVLFVLLRDPAARLPGLPRPALLLGAALSTAAYGAIHAHQQYDDVGGALEVGRNFFGALRVSARGSEAAGDLRHRLLHGSVIHGQQYMTGERRYQPTTYYSPIGGAGMAITLSRGSGPQSVGIVGLGAGTLLTYARPEDRYRAYEINPLVLDMARRHFTYLQDVRGKLDLVLGDGRLALEREPAQGFDVLLVDAFSGDSVPAHLLTQEAFALYFRHLKPDGVLAVHVTNRFLDLPPIVKLAAERHGYPSVLVSNQDDDALDAYHSDWVLVSKRGALLQNPKIQAARNDAPIRPGIRPWTDDFSSLLPILK